MPVPFIRAQCINRSLVVSDHGAEGSRNEMQFVLDHEVRRRASPAGVQPEEVSRLRIPGKERELIDRSDEERGARFINGFIDHVERQSILEIAIGIVAEEFYA